MDPPRVGIVCAGSVTVFRISPQGRQVATSVLSPGDWFENVFPMASHERTFYQADQPLTVAWLEATTFQRVMRTYPDFGLELIRGQVRRLADVEARVSQNALDTVAGTVALAILQMAEREGRTDLHVTHEELAQRLGTVRESVSLAISKLRRAGVLAPARNRKRLISIPEPAEARAVRRLPRGERLAFRIRRAGGMPGRALEFAGGHTVQRIGFVADRHGPSAGGRDPPPNFASNVPAWAATTRSLVLSNALRSPALTTAALARSPERSPVRSVTVSPFLTVLRCAECAHADDPRRPQTVCTHCGGTLLPEYDTTAMAARLSKAEVAARPRGLWRYAELLPVGDLARAPNLGEGDTPLLPLRRLSAHLGLRDVWLKDEGANPTGTFKARGAAVGVARALELGLRELAIPTAGNAGSAWAAYAAAAGVTLHVVMPVETPEPIKAECRAYGADVTEVRGVISDAGRVVAARCAAHGWFDVSTMKEPYRVDGKKTMGLELVEAFDWDPPDVLLYPTGGGVGLIGIWKAMEELAALGWIDAKRTRLVAVQAAGCRPIVDAFATGAASAQRVADPQTIAAGLRVPLPFAHRLILRILRATRGTAVAVSDAEIRAGMRTLASVEGIFACPEGASLVPALQVLAARGDVRPEERVVLLNTGNGLKYTHLVPPGDGVPIGPPVV
ncbi:MAG: threonine synthase [Actinobacteria bacterium]|nr:threonine synthase [Actinomycetota bacterium]